MPNNDGENLDKAWASRAEAEAICDANWAEAEAEYKKEARTAKAEGEFALAKAAYNNALAEAKAAYEKAESAYLVANPGGFNKVAFLHF